MIEDARLRMVDGFVETVDHELSLVAPIAFFCLLGYLSYLAALAVRCLFRWVFLRSVGTTDSGSDSRCSSNTEADTTGLLRQRAATLVLLLLAVSDLPSRLRNAVQVWQMQYGSTVGNRSSDNSNTYLHPRRQRYHSTDPPPPVGLSDLIVGQDPRLRQILQRVPDLLQGPSPPWLLYNRHVQFVPFMIQNEIHRLQGIPYQRMYVHVKDCQHKLSHNCSHLHSHPPAVPVHTRDERGNTHTQMHLDMSETITVDIFPPFDNVPSPYNKHFNDSSPVILFNPGLRCHSQDLPGTTIIRKAYQAGIRSIVVNRRGHTPDQRLRSPRWNLFGDVDDMEQVYWHLKEELLAPHTPIFYHGISSGTSVTVTSMSKWDRRRIEQPHRPSPSFVASVSLTPGYDISRVLGRDRFLWPYNDILLPGVKDTFILQNEAILREYDSDAVDAALAATNLQEFVDAAAPFTGFGNETSYYREINPINDLHDITTPKLVLNALDDPCCSISNLYERSPYDKHGTKSYAEMIAETQATIAVVTRTGSHCPFFDSPKGGSFFVRDAVTGGWMLNSWADRVAIDFYLAALEVYNERRFL